jgi:outer membrane protein assembly factor BamB
MVQGRGVYADDYARVCEREILRKAPALQLEQEKIAASLLTGKGEIAGPPHLLRVIRAYPNSAAAAKAYLQLGEYCNKEKLLVSAELYLSEFLFRNPQSHHADKARALLAETYLAKNDLLRAKELLKVLSNSDTNIVIEDKTLKASEYAGMKLALPDVEKAKIKDSLLLPLSKLWQTTPSLAQSAPDILGISSDDKILYALGSNLLDCRNTQTGALAARFDLSNPPLPAGARRTGIVVEDGAVILWGKRLLKVGTVEDKQAWKWGVTLTSPDNTPGTVTRDQPQLERYSTGILVLWPRNRLTLFDEKTGEQLWEYKSGRPLLALPVEIKGALLFVYADGDAALALDVKTGVMKFNTKLKGNAQAASSITKCGDHALILRGSRDIYCLDGNGNILWEKKGGAFFSSVVYLAPDRIALMPRAGAKHEVSCLDLANGNETWRSELGKDQVVAHLADRSNLYVVQKPRFGVTTVIAINSTTGKARWSWRQPQGGYAVVNQTPTHLICCVVDRLISRIHIISKARGVQDQTITLFAEMYQSGLVRNGNLFITTDRCAYRFGSVKHAWAREQYVNILYRLDRGMTSLAEFEKLAARYAEFKDFDDAADALSEVVKADWKLPETETRRLMERAGGFRYGLARPGSPVIEVPIMAGPVKIDGVLDDGWLPVLGIERGLEGIFKVDRAHATGGEWLSKNDLSATFHFAWDKENFYLAVDARDSIIRPWDRDEKEIWKGDFLLIALDPLGDGGWMARADDILLSMGLTLPRQNLTQEEREEEERNKPKGEYFVKRREDDSGVVYEVKIPWELFNENGTNIDSEKGPPDNFTFGLELVLLDDDTGGATTKTLNLARGLLLGKRNALWRAFVPRKFATIRLKSK